MIASIERGRWRRHDRHELHFQMPRWFRYILKFTGNVPFFPVMELREISIFIATIIILRHGENKALKTILALSAPRRLAHDDDIYIRAVTFDNFFLKFSLCCMAFISAINIKGYRPLY